MDFDASRDHLEKRMLAQAGSVGELLGQFRSRIPPDLIDGLGWEKLLERANAMPISMATSGFGFELPLHEPEPRADFGVALFEGSRSAAHFADWCRSQSADSSFEALARLLGRMDHDPALRRIGGAKLMLEYDIDPTRYGNPPLPGVFLYPETVVPSGGDSAQGLEDFGVIADAVNSACGLESHDSASKRIQRLLQVMPSGASIGSVGAFPDRGRGLRIAVTGLRTARELTETLERAGWPGQPARIYRFVNDMEQRGAFAHLAAHLDLETQGFGPKLGVSFYASDAQWVANIGPWMNIIGGIRELGLAVAAKLTALADSWSGAETMFGRKTVLLVVKGIHHVKVVSVGDRFTEVKAYVFVLLFPATPNSSTSD